MSEIKTIYAHTKEGNPPSEWQLLKKHLENVAEQARNFASESGSGDWATILGILHDIGKAHPDFQRYLLKVKNLDDSEYDEQSVVSHPNHSGAGAILAYEKYSGIIGKIFAYIIAGHHAGLPDWFGGMDSLSYRLKNEKDIADVVRDYSESFITKLPNKIQPPAFAMYCKNQDAISFHLWVRMLFSCLVDADFLDTEAAMDQEKHAQRPSFPLLCELKSNFDIQLLEMIKGARETVVNRIRSEILDKCRKAALQPPGIFALTVPTGGGKTLSGTAFALDHAIQHGKTRIIYVIPYTSIIEQTANILRKYFGVENVVEHHSNISIEKDMEMPQLTLATENWDAPIIVTTSVQFFESLYSAKPGKCRKLHNIVNSVVILDEAQLIPPELLYPCVDALNRLVSDYKTTIVLSTATQPALPNLSQIPREIVTDAISYYEKLRRTTINFPDNINQPLDWDSLSSELVAHEQVLCIVNTRKDCHSLWQEMPEGTIHLSALMCGAHRSRTIAYIKKRIALGKPCRVISTQLVEAGVDINFPTVYRALAGLDSINQAAGRCNREGELSELGNVRVFIAPKPAPPGLLRKGEDTTRELASIKDFSPDNPEMFHRYFKKYYSSINDDGENWWRENLIKNVNPDGNVQFRTAGKEFRLIKEASAPIIVRYNRNDNLIEKLRFAGPSRLLMRSLQRFTVNIKPDLADRLLSEARIEEIYKGIFVQSDSRLYRSDIGLDIFRDAYTPEDLYI